MGNMADYGILDLLEIELGPNGFVYMATNLLLPWNILRIAASRVPFSCRCLQVIGGSKTAEKGIEAFPWLIC